MTTLGDALLRDVAIPGDDGKARAFLAKNERSWAPVATASLALMACSGAGKRRNERKNGLWGLEPLDKTARASSMIACVMAFTIDTQGQGCVAPDPARTEARALAHRRTQRWQRRLGAHGPARDIGHG